MKLFLSILSLSFSLSLFSVDIEALSEKEMQLVVTDETIRQEYFTLNQLQVEAYQYISETENSAIEVSEAIFSFYRDEISNEELWLILDPIKESAFKSSEAFEKRLSSLSFRSKSDEEFFHPIYNFSYDNISSLNNFLRDYANNLVNQIESLETGDVERYDMYVSQNQITGAQLNLRQADIKELGSKILPTSNVNHFLGQIDAHASRVAAFFLLTNGNYMLDELDKKSFKEFISKARDSFKMQKSDYLKRKMFNRMESVENLLRSLATPSELALFLETREALNLFYMSSISQSENYLKILELFEKNQDKLSYSGTEGEIQMLNEWDYLNSKIAIDADQTLKSGIAFNQGLIELNNVILKYSSVNSKN